MPKLPRKTQPKGEKRIPVFVRISKSVDRALEIESARRDVTKSQLVEDAIRAYLGLPEAA